MAGWKKEEKEETFECEECFEETPISDMVICPECGEKLCRECAKETGVREETVH